MIWVAIASAICIALAVIAFSMQGTSKWKGDSVVATALPPQQQSGNPKARTKEVGDKAKDPEAPKVLCTLTTVQAPDVAGLRLGMTSEDVLAAFPGSREDAEVRSDLARPAHFGSIRFLIVPEKYASKAKFAGIKKITFTFLDGRISNMNVGYNGPEWKNVDEFVAKFSEGKTLPTADAWEAVVGMDTQLKTLKCDGFEISVFAGGKGGNINYVQMRDVAAEKEIENRRAKAREKAEKEAKP
jgi:hypothetical protein